MTDNWVIKWAKAIHDVEVALAELQEATRVDLPPFPPMQTAHWPADEDVKL